ncbi:hypothetical protein ANN_09405 [Periplaneta americana]|uniref:Uncharacterized protein n=1 Tax=Periplaneta americana TaxID=6978 RepID=A0ABQ8TL85_PERAM|nr:hypothetical protein ANN_09405 [Periplaneta americana]
MKKICARWVPHSLKEENMWQRMETARLYLERYGREGERFLRHIITLDEIWFQCYQPQLKGQSNEWRHNDSPRPKKYRQEQDPLNGTWKFWGILSMSPCDFDFFAKMKLSLRGVRFRTRQAIIAAVEQTVRRLVQQDAVDGIRLSLRCGGGFFMLDEITSEQYGSTEISQNFASVAQKTTYTLAMTAIDPSSSFVPISLQRDVIVVHRSGDTKYAVSGALLANCSLLFKVCHGSLYAVMWLVDEPREFNLPTLPQRRITYVPEKLPSKYGVHSEEYLPVRTVTPVVAGIATAITITIGEQITILKESINSHAPNQEKVNAEFVAQRMKRIAIQHPEIPPVQILCAELTRVE